MHGTRKAQPRPNWRLRKTLARRVEVRVMMPDDIKFLWAAYKMGALGAMDARLEGSDLDAEAFRTTFDDIATRYNDAWTISAETKSGFRPAGVVFGAVAPLSAHMIVAGIIWFPWATKRNVVEGAVSFFNEARNHIPMMLYATNEHKRMYEVCCMHGIMRRIGTSEIVFPGQSAACYETRAKK